jgi:hypothetical protein
MYLREIEIGGEKRHIAFTFNALAMFGKITGLNMMQMERLATAMEFEHIIALTYAGLKDGNRVARKDNPTLPVFTYTLEDIGDWLSEDPAKFAEVFTEFAEAQARPVDGKKKEAETQE